MAPAVYGYGYDAPVIGRMDFTGWTAIKMVRGARGTQHPSDIN
jgi:hypothetical protein